MSKVSKSGPPGLFDHLSEDEKLNWEIIALLQEDGRMAFSTIAEKVGVSEGTVRNRVRQLRQDNAIQIVAEAAPAAFGFQWNSVVLLKLNPSADIDKVATRLAAVPEVYYVVQMTGVHDLAVTSFHRDQEHFREFLGEHLYGHNDIIALEPNINLKVYKMKLKWDPSKI